MSPTATLLLQPSHHHADRGQLIGSDPRVLDPSAFSAAGIPLQLAKDAIRAKCLDCVGDVDSEVRKCVAVACPLWPFRITGSLPSALKRSVLGEARQAPQVLPQASPPAA